jgi:hypothetical protein
MTHENWCTTPDLAFIGNNLKCSRRDLRRRVGRFPTRQPRKYAPRGLAGQAPTSSPAQ